jgi:RNA polymerase sigma factor (sigma-70 family)
MSPTGRRDPVVLLVPYVNRKRSGTAGLAAGLNHPCNEIRVEVGRDAGESGGRGVPRFRGAVLANAAAGGYLLLRDQDAAEDALQSALLRTFRRWSRARAAPEAFSQRVLINVCRNYWRHQRRHPIHASTEEHAFASSAILERDRIDQRLAIEDALAALPDRQREVLVLRFFLDLSVPQTAQLLKIPEGSVKSATHRGLAALRQLLTDEPQEVHSGH